MGLAAEIVSVVYSRGCVSLDELQRELERRLGPVDRRLLKNMVAYLKRSGRIASPHRAVYCRPRG